jgi:integrase/recombinase XerD
MTGYVTLRGKTGERVVPVSEMTSRLLEALKSKKINDNCQQHIFLGRRGPLRYEGIYKLIRRLCHLAGINGKRCSPHTFRHTFGTNYAAAEGCDPKVLQDILGHRDFKTTLRYIQNNPRRMAQNHQRCTPLKAWAAAAQERLFDATEVIREAEAIVNVKQNEQE